MKKRAFFLTIAVAVALAIPSLASQPISTATATQATIPPTAQNSSKEVGENLPPYLTFVGYKFTEAAITALTFGGLYYMLSYKTSKATTFEPIQSEVRLAALAGEHPKEINSLIDQIKNPARYTAMNVSLPSGVLLHGKPGTGKTKLAQAIAGELEVPFFEICGSQLESKWIGEAEANIRKLFAAAKDVTKPDTQQNHSIKAVVFIDEIDSIAPSRNNVSSTHHTKQIVDQLLAVLNNAKKDNILVIGATNYINSVDEAVKRPGRFDITVEMSLPSSADRLAILKQYTKNDALKRLELDQKKFDEFIKQQQGTEHLKKGYLKTKPELFKLSVDLGKVAQAADGMSGAELEELCNKARRACIEAQPPRTHLEQQDFNQALALMGKRRSSASGGNN